MAIAFDAATTIQSAAGTSLTWSHTCTGLQGLLIVGVSNVVPGGDLVTGVTYNGVAMTRVATLAGAGSQQMYVYALANPSTGANNVVVSTSGSTNLNGRSVSYTGGKQISTLDNSATNSASAVTSIAGTLTPTVDNCWTVGWFRNDLTNTVSAGGGTTMRSTSNAAVFGDSNGVIHPAASTSLSFSWTGSANAAVIIVSIAPVAASGAMFAVF